MSNVTPRAIPSWFQVVLRIRRGEGVVYALFQVSNAILLIFPSIFYIPELSWMWAHVSTFSNLIIVIVSESNLLWWNPILNGVLSFHCLFCLFCAINSMESRDKIPQMIRWFNEFQFSYENPGFNQAIIHYNWDFFAE